jgi:hypothetical protein
MHRFFATLSIVSLLFVSCKEENRYGYVRLAFEHYWDDEPIQIDKTTPYINAAGNILTFDRLEYFISDLTLSGASVVKVEHPNIRYITNDTAYSILLLTYQIPTGNYSDIHFTFGLDSEKNKSGIFSNPPQSNMFWPETMGGGYHYMKIDGWWRNEGEVVTTPFGLHLGALEEIIRHDTVFANQQRDSVVSITPVYQKIHNHFPVSISRNFRVEHQKITTVDPIIMDVKKWMEGRSRWDFNVMGGAIMSRQRALDSLAQNGRNVFR